ncbi:phosphoribosylpyrophosphate synthetase [Phenylobacterium zucineum HLK1]|uniref:Phosphoribosylpyrophosphate synthetase n=1 Tax=Phenylobacterium zucineum (strain HLK1) TaxID=450851 RepID=B4RED4_PHEZH|nr:ribose-phosphate diphosphokinase [Phenylobacterium zucineum]ACG76876.1 phosphoribosylpyrophosphate synthetase [Phenylobacterium zucineum HLK1]
MRLVVHAFADEEAPASRLAAALGVPLRLVDVHAFPDGETLPRVPETAPTVIVYRSLDRPNPKLMPLMLACDAWRRAGAQRLVLVAPYLCYMRQDTVFEPGQSLSRDVIGALLGARFDRIVTVNPHLHRTSDLSAVFGCDADALSAAEDLARTLGGDGEPVVVGPDVESAPWAADVAGFLGAPSLTLAKRRRGDREVELSVPDPAMVAGRRAILVDDICSSGATLALAARRLVAAGAASVEIAVTHALFEPSADARLRAAGVQRIVSTDSCPHPTNAVALAPLLAVALAGEGAQPREGVKRAIRS